MLIDMEINNANLYYYVWYMNLNSFFIYFKLKEIFVEIGAKFKMNTRSRAIKLKKKKLYKSILRKIWNILSNNFKFSIFEIVKYMGYSPLIPVISMFLHDNVMATTSNSIYEQKGKYFHWNSLWNAVLLYFISKNIKFSPKNHKCINRLCSFSK